MERGDRIVLNLPMPIRLMQAHPLVEECRGQVAVQRGPLIYCLESSDLPSGVKVLDCAIDRQSNTEQWTVERSTTDQSRLNKLPGITTIRAELIHRSSDQQPSSTELYSPFKPASHKTISASLIPYYAWGNRGKSEMTVWIPIAAR